LEKRLLVKIDSPGDNMGQLSEKQKQKILKYMKKNSDQNPLVTEIYIGGKKTSSEHK
jgi:hypothetical protein